ncbi:hypothetical protein HK097_011104 [Rhizophlyctis rosea]|uniref:Uncharacterized protein n=1 Tax=Rhizophlyctis rosea TaxID=64517 RepID=A0AAD5X797_9FUNG|nr:hypothetical protein HK097_011104 [Rhizophlyctis rosea]
MKLPSLLQISLHQNAVHRKHLYRFTIIMRFPHLLSIDNKEVTEDERRRAEVSFMEQCLARDDPLTKLSAAPVGGGGSAGGSVGGLGGVGGGSMNPLVKLPIKITSVVLDGLEMKLAANSSGFGSSSILPTRQM